MEEAHQTGPKSEQFKSLPGRPEFLQPLGGLSSFTLLCCVFCPNRIKVTSEKLLLSPCLLVSLHPGWLLSSVLAASQLSISLPPDGRPYVGRTQSPKDTAAQRERHGEQVPKDWLVKGSVLLARGLTVAATQPSEMGELTLDINRVRCVSETTLAPPPHPVLSSKGRVRYVEKGIREGQSFISAL